MSVTSTHSRFGKKEKEKASDGVIACFLDPQKQKQAIDEEEAEEGGS